MTAFALFLISFATKRPNLIFWGETLGLVSFGVSWLLASRILPLFPDHGCYVEPFCGAAALYFLKVPAKVEVLNDVNGELVNLYRVVQHHLEEFVRQFKWR